jgi:selenocysteine lyase/cysteine desulfurase
MWANGYRNFIRERRMVEQITPYQGGGEMIKDVSFEKTTYAETA